MAVLKYMLGIHVERDQHTGDIFMHQQKFIQEKLDHLIPSPILALSNQQLYVDMSQQRKMTLTMF